ncbi:hypothetical protein [uncultured Desulfobacter sp.]|uniref:hypothetical protein n=1 Tax=uncultured Desulfobacter sp. TaxID=240139 RepID=UPI002AAB1F63|nr:hypothetical protein [uncultured Desulfobacter sp.]
MSAEEITVKKSHKIDQKIRDICINYMELMLTCGRDEKNRDSFFENPRPYLNGIGMVIPEKVSIHLKVGQSFPALFLKTAEGKIAIYEGKLCLKVVEEMRDHTKHMEKVVLKEQGEIDVNVHASLNDPDVQGVVVMPFFDLYTDILGEVKFQDGAEIILTSC